MSRPTFINSHVEYHDNSTEYNIDARGKDINAILRACETQDIEVVQEESRPATNYFRHMTEKCIAENRVDAVNAEIKAACKGPAELLWRTLWNNENLGYVVVAPIDATTLYKDIENFYGKLPYKERQFRAARNSR